MCCYSFSQSLLFGLLSVTSRSISKPLAFDALQRAGSAFGVITAGVVLLCVIRGVLQILDAFFLARAILISGKDRQKYETKVTVTVKRENRMVLVA